MIDVNTKDPAIIKAFLMGLDSDNEKIAALKKSSKKKQESVKRPSKKSKGELI